MAPALQTTALITDMNEPLASAAGNAVEVLNAVDFLTGRRRDTRLDGGDAGARRRNAGRRRHRRLATRTACRVRCEALEQRPRRRDASAAWSRRSAARPISWRSRSPTCRRRRSSVAVLADSAGYVTGIATRDIGLAVVALGGGRTTPDDVDRPRVGFTGLLPIGAEAVKGEPLAIVHARTRRRG